MELTATNSNATNGTETAMEPTEPQYTTTIMEQQEPVAAVTFQYEPFLALLIGVGILAGILISRTLWRRM